MDFVSHIQGRIYPIVVKAGATGRLRSLRLFLKEKGSDFGVQISQAPSAYSDQILFIPFYMLFRLPEILSEL